MGDSSLTKGSRHQPLSKEKPKEDLDLQRRTQHSMGCGFSKSVARVSRATGPPIPPMPRGDDRLPEQRNSAHTKSTHPAPQSVADPLVAPANEGVQTFAGRTTLQAWTGPTRLVKLAARSTPGLMRERTAGGKTGTSVHSSTTHPTRSETMPRSPAWVENGPALPRRWDKGRT